MSVTPDPFAAPGRNRPDPSPAAIAALVECRRAKELADGARTVVADMPGQPDVSAAGGEVLFVVQPKTLADWQRWLDRLGVDDARGDSNGVAMAVRCTLGGIRARLVGYGVPALYGAALPVRPARRTAARS
ncbi:hypothetical protein AB0N17_20270 [Streptomyces sp. NPDC051133]|uniref:hypothetical protein n=1 Tax=Streptomyces sp. NPDC051133 TaxID=3155521 RepID=UPI00342C1CF4